MLRTYSADDEDAVISLYLASTIAGQSFLPEEFWRADATEVQRHLPEAETWVIEDAGDLVAFASVIDNLLVGLFTHPDHHRNGHGTTLVRHLHARHDPLFVEVFAANEAAVRFYRNRGFTNQDESTEERSGLTQLTLRLGGD